MDTSKVIVITGASDGIGAATARSLAKAGHQVVVVGRSPEKTNRIAAELDADSHIADFADFAAVRALAATLQAKYPRIDVLANNAGRGSLRQVPASHRRRARGGILGELPRAVPADEPVS
jgi:NAD(P)-dependent dehydrogenase (short-subunit alcohol dehydrogenase family)